MISERITVLSSQFVSRDTRGGGGRGSLGSRVTSVQVGCWAPTEDVLRKMGKYWCGTVSVCVLGTG